MSADFQIINDFLRLFEHEEVQGRGVDCGPVAPPAEVDVRLRRFAAGNCSPAERQEICLLLDQHRDWMGHFAEIIRATSTPSGSRSNPQAGAAKDDEEEEAE